MREGQEGDVDIKDVRKPVFQALLYFTYTDQLPEVWQHNGNPEHSLSIIISRL